MKTFKILGSGCAKCRQTERVVRQTLSEAGLEAEIIKVEDMMEIMKYNVLTTPVLVVDEEIKIKGRIPKKEEIIELMNA